MSLLLSKEALERAGQTLESVPACEIVALREESPIEAAGHGGFIIEHSGHGATQEAGPLKRKIRQNVMSYFARVRM